MRFHNNKMMRLLFMALGTFTVIGGCSRSQQPTDKEIQSELLSLQAESDKLHDDAYSMTQEELGIRKKADSAGLADSERAKLNARIKLFDDERNAKMETAKAKAIELTTAVEKYRKLGRIPQAKSH